MRRQTSMPSKSGRPRSRMTRSGIGQRDLLHGLGACLREDDLVPARRQPDAERLEQRWVVVDHQHLGHAASDRCRHDGLGGDGEYHPGAVLTSGSIQMCPPWASTNALAMARPSPARPPPPFWLNISKTRSRPRRRCPGPRRRRRSPPWSVRSPVRPAPSRRMTLPLGDSRAAFSRRLASTWLIRTWSICSRGRSAGASRDTARRDEAVE